MRKTDKKIEKQLIASLTDVCEISLKAFTGFQWLTHFVHYSNFPKSLNVVCVFDTNDNLAAFLEAGKRQELSAIIQTKLCEIGINLKNASQHISYDTEENCQKSHNGKWADRFG
ncbi:Fis family transcriptional regulator [Marinomonas sp. 2405UD68-3]|uniref:Fis family transcriptional regulator n=1 Tax=Marinomonas sp. 2405UD68-3 TaxID=3391835 RepID=UPI0039C9470B